MLIYKVSVSRTSDCHDSMRTKLFSTFDKAAAFIFSGFLSFDFREGQVRATAGRLAVQLRKQGSEIVRAHSHLTAWYVRYYHVSTLYVE